MYKNFLNSSENWFVYFDEVSCERRCSIRTQREMPRKVQAFFYEYIIKHLNTKG